MFATRISAFAEVARITARSSDCSIRGCWLLGASSAMLVVATDVERAPSGALAREGNVTFFFWCVKPPRRSVERADNLGILRRQRYPIAPRVLLSHALYCCSLSAQDVNVTPRATLQGERLSCVSGRGRF
jgi:hypothetical protein